MTAADSMGGHNFVVQYLPVKRYQMRTRAKILAGITVILTAFVAWTATESNPYTYGSGESFVQPYPWNYPLWAFVFGTLVTVLLSPNGAFARLIGSAVSVVGGSVLTVLLLLSAMHSLPAHSNLMYVMFFSTQALLFYCGYAFANWRSERYGGPTEVDE